MSLDWEILALDFGGFSTDDIADKTLRAFGFHISAIRYLEKESLYFINITDLELTAKPAVVDNPSQVVTDFEEKMVKKKNKRAAKRKERLAKLYALVGFLLSPYSEFSLLLLSYFVPVLVPDLVPAPMLALVAAFVPALLPAPMPTPFSCSRSSVVLLSGCVPTPSAVFYCEILALMSSLLMFSLSFLLGSSPLKTFK